jgi:hypothetical protein
MGLGDVFAAEGDIAAARACWLAAEAALDRVSHPLVDEVRVKLAALDSQAEPDHMIGAVSTGPHRLVGGGALTALGRMR